MSFATNLRQAREKRGLSQSALAALCGIAATSISHFEAGRRKPSYDNMAVLCEALDPLELFGSNEASSFADAKSMTHADVCSLQHGDFVHIGAALFRFNAPHCDDGRRAFIEVKVRDLRWRYTDE